MVLNANAKREQGKVAQKANITAAKAVSDIVRTTLGPKSMLKMLLDPMGGIVLTNDGNAILREVSERARSNHDYFPPNLENSRILLLIMLGFFLLDRCCSPCSQVYDRAVQGPG